MPTAIRLKNNSRPNGLCLGQPRGCWGKGGLPLSLQTTLDRFELLSCALCVHVFVLVCDYHTLCVSSFFPEEELEDVVRLKLLLRDQRALRPAGGRVSLPESESGLLPSKLWEIRLPKGFFLKFYQNNFLFIKFLNKGFVKGSLTKICINFSSKEPVL